MAERRMFAKTVIDSDAFLEMPQTTQNLYFHLCMRADDDGFINNPKKIMRFVGSTDDDLRVLISKRFILVFETGVIVIKHWKMHNYIRNDRYKETVYVEEKSRLLLSENGAYTERKSLPGNNVNQMDTVGIPNDNQMVYQMETQVRLGKGSNVEKEKRARDFDPFDEPTQDPPRDPFDDPPVQSTVADYHPCKHAPLWNQLKLTEFRRLAVNISSTELDACRRANEAYRFDEIQKAIKNYARVMGDRETFQEKTPYKSLVTFLANGGVEAYLSIDHYRRGARDRPRAQPAVSRQRTQIDLED